MKKGLIVNYQLGVYKIYCESSYYNVKVKGKFKLNNIVPLVGDRVIFDEEKMLLVDIEERKNSLIRPHIANVDQMFIIMSMVQPNFSYNLLFRFLVYMNMNAIPSVIVLSKTDLDTEKEYLKVKELLDYLHIPCIIYSKRSEVGVDSILSYINNHFSCVMGLTAVGKSSLLNILDKETYRNIGDFSLSLNNGKHETKDITLYKIKEGFLADTPGFNILDINLFKEDLSYYFPLIKDNLDKCQFNNCQHINEKNCYIKEKAKHDKMFEVIYLAYTEIYKSLKSKKDMY